MARQKKQQFADFDKIDTTDLSNDERLKMLYIEAVRRGFWHNDTGRALDFFSLAEKALKEDKQGTPGKLFYALIKNKNLKYVTDEMERAAGKRLPSGDRQELVDRAADLTLTARPVPEETQNALYGRDIGYHHGIMAQCFMPQKEMPIETREWQVDHGRASLMIEAGRVADTSERHAFRKTHLPSGAKARLIMPYIIGYAVQRNTRTIDMGRNLYRFMQQLGVPVSGQNGKELTRQVENIAAASFILGGWEEDRVMTRYARVASELSFWIEKKPDQGALWRPEMELSAEFFDAIKERRVPVDMGHLMKLGKSPRRMDLYCWLSYRLPRIRKGRGVTIKLRDLQPIFAPEITRPQDFKRRLANDLKAIAAVYPDFRLTLEKDALRLEKSPPPVPPKLIQFI